MCMGGGGLIVKLIVMRCNLPTAIAICDVLMVPGLMCIVWVLTNRIRLPTILVRNSFALYLMHGIFLTISIIPVTLLGMRAVMYSSLVIVLLRMSFAIVMSLLCAELIRHTMPSIASVLLGGR